MIFTIHGNNHNNKTLILHPTFYDNPSQLILHPPFTNFFVSYEPCHLLCLSADYLRRGALGQMPLGQVAAKFSLHFKGLWLLS